ncbi:MAG: hypothetical protein ACRCYY_06755 [Trueperaceae bacterium]
MIKHLRIEQQGLVLGRVENLELDMWYFWGSFKPTEKFAEVKPLFDKAYEFLEKEEYEAWDEFFSHEIMTKDLCIVDSDEEKYPDFILHIHEQKAWGKLS